MSMEPIQTDRAPAAIGPYSQGMAAGDFIFYSGQIPLDPVSGELVGHSVEEQTEQVMKNMEGALAGAGLGFAHVVKTTIFLTDLGSFATVNEIYGRRFPQKAPARATVEVSALPKGALVEIEWVAYRGK